jgi:hypothetical protein
MFYYYRLLLVVINLHKLTQITIYYYCDPLLVGLFHLSFLYTWFRPSVNITHRCAAM